VCPASRDFFRNVLNSCVDIFTRPWPVKTASKWTSQKLFSLKSSRQNCKRLLKNLMRKEINPYEIETDHYKLVAGSVIYYSKTRYRSLTRSSSFSLLFESAPHHQVFAIWTSTRAQNWFVRTYVANKTCIRTSYIHMCIYEWIPTLVRVCIYVRCVCVYVYVCMHLRKCIYVCMLACV